MMTIVAANRQSAGDGRVGPRRTGPEGTTIIEISPSIAERMAA
jgi:hypothetical protein